ncbi:MAG: ASKHA domain-containing protein [candidate division NC10 bacterium]|nr:ASKHA domain-containing protein [candidate division NC10 bacterium]
MPSCRVAFEPLGISTTVEAGTSLLEAAGKAGISINSICGGDGICGRCKMVVKEGHVAGDVSSLLTRAEIRQDMVLACQSYVQSDLVVEIPEETQARERFAIDQEAQRFRAFHPGLRPKEFAKSPLVLKLCLRLPPPTLENETDDCQRIQRMVEKLTGLTSMQIGLKVIKRVPEIVRKHNFTVTAIVGRRRDIGEIMDIEGGDTSGRNYFAIVDVGTSTIVVHLVDVIHLSTVDAQACFNSQAIYGREVTSRIMAAERRGVEVLQNVLVEDINRLISGMAEKNGISLKDITAVVCAGNTTMMHFLLGLPTGNIRREPFVAATLEPPPFRAAEVGIKINPRGLLYTIPGISAWVGGDLTAGILATGLYEMDEIGMLIDIGTNGEIIVGNKDWLVACSASAGPALEGASVECGMVVEAGAIENVFLQNGRIGYKVVGNMAPAGLCGSGIIDLISVLLEKKIINRAGKLIRGSDPRVRFENGQARFVLSKGDEPPGGRELYITQDDIDNVITAKAAIFAAAKILLDRLEVKLSDVKRLFIAGGFGSYINRENAIKIGLLPDLPVSNIEYVGNTSILGAKLAALSEEAFQLLREIRKKTTYYDLLGTPDYVEKFKQALFLPHTNIELFPSLLAHRDN